MYVEVGLHLRNFFLFFIFFIFYRGIELGIDNLNFTGIGIDYYISGANLEHSTGPPLEPEHNGNPVEPLLEPRHTGNPVEPENTKYQKYLNI